MISKEITAEEKARRIEKQREGARRNRERRAEWERQREAEKQAQITALREIRDSAEATPGERLKAVEMLDRLTVRY